MEWIEVSARTLEEARELALDRLGVVSDELEYEVIDEPRGGLFGLGRTDARIRARVKPLSREKPPDRRRRRTTERRPNSSSRKPRGEGRSPERARSESRDRPEKSDEQSDRPADQAEGSRAVSSRSRRRGRGGGAGAVSAESAGEGPRSQGRGDRPEAKMDAEPEAQDLDVEAQAEHAAQFAGSLVEAMGLKGSASARVDDETVLVAIDGDGLGLLVGPGGKTLMAVEELVRAVVQHGLSGRSARLRVDVGGYRERRREALGAFARQVAEEVRANNLERALEPMNPPDRKVVHDAVAEIDGVATSSEGEEPRRRVVISPA
ncbi:MAG: spoIIIJ-associated protein [Actinomycetota bacterium]|nr:spoIIIJ-associated protein [Actinomycetota bacterium]